MPRTAPGQHMPKKPRRANAVLIFGGGRKLLLWTICEKLAPFTMFNAKQLYIMLRHHLAVETDPDGRAWGIQTQIAKELDISRSHVSHMVANFGGRKLPSPEKLKNNVHRRKDFLTHHISKAFIASNSLVLLAGTGQIPTDLSEIFSVSKNLLSTQVPELALILRGDVEDVEYVEPHRAGDKKGEEEETDENRGESEEGQPG